MSTQGNDQALQQRNGGPGHRLLPPSNSELSVRDGVLEATVLSVYDLPYSEPPLAVTISACGVTVSSGPPAARHKNRNSFRFSALPSNSSNNSTSTASTGNGSKNDLKLVTSLRNLYKEKATIRVLYSGESKLLQTDYELRQLRINESKWLILNLTNNSSSQAMSLPDTNEEPIPPTIRLKFHLSGPYRPEIAALVGLGQAWFSLVDRLCDSAVQAYFSSPKFPFDPKNLILASTPLAVIFVVASPVVAGIAVIVLPFLLPIVLAVAGIVASLIIGSGLVYSSSRAGRELVGGLLGPLFDSLLSSRAGQQLIYDTGPRPTPVSVAEQVVPNDVWMKLAFSLLIDLIGSSSYLIPVAGEALDVAWAPIQTILIMAMYDPTTPNLKYVSFVEEILPFTDIVPTATVGWAFEFVPGLLGHNSGLGETSKNVVSEGKLTSIGSGSMS